MTRSYRMLKDSTIAPEAKVGTVVFRCKGHDYGCASDDTRMTGIEHISVTFHADGSYPFFTVPLSDLKLISA